METEVIVARRSGKVGNPLLVFHFSITPRPGCGNVGISQGLRDFQGTVGGVGSLLLAFHAFHSPVISTAAFGLVYANRGGNGDSTLQARSSLLLAAVIRFAQAVSLMRLAILSNWAKPRPGFKYCFASGSDFSFS